MSGPRKHVLDMIPKRKIGIEIGVWRGDFSRKIIQFSNPSLLYLVDPFKFDERYPLRWYGGFKATSQDEMDLNRQMVISRFENDPVKVITKESSKCWDLIDITPDWAYIDGNHSFDACLNDIFLCRENMKPGSCLFLDDYHLKSVREAVITAKSKGLIGDFEVSGTQVLTTLS